VREQAADIGLYFDHERDWRIGSVVSLQRSNAWGLMAAAILDVDVSEMLADGPWYLSDSITCRKMGQSLYRGEARLQEISLVRRSGNCDTHEVVWSEGDFGLGTSAAPSMPLYWRSMWDRAAQAASAYRYTRSKPLRIYDADELNEVDRAFADPSLLRRRAEPEMTGSVTANGRTLSPAASQRLIDFFEFGGIAYA
jgi:hypothetical protein